jgi:endonuclease-8
VPEGDTIHCAAARLHAALAGQTLRRTDFRVPRFATADLSGHVVGQVTARGKHLLFRLDRDVTIHTHFKMDGIFHLLRARQRWKVPAFRVRLVLETDAWQAVGVDLATCAIWATSREAEVLGTIGRDPLGADWDPDEALRRLIADPERPIAEVLLDQTVIAGPGNVWKCEICFLRGLDPWTPVGRVRDPARLVRLTKQLFEANRTLGSHVTTGDVRPGRRHWVYGRGGEPCRRCGTPIRVQRGDGERTTFWCPQCQPAIPA